MEVSNQLIHAGRSRGMGLSRLSRRTVNAQGRVAFTLPLRVRGRRLSSSAPYSGSVRLYMLDGERVGLQPKSQAISACRYDS